MPDDADMDTNTTSAESNEARAQANQPPPRPPLVRPVQRRVIAGVAAGLAQTMGISTGLVRLAFVIATLFGGAGIALYLAGWLLIRSEDRSQSPVQRLLDNRGSVPAWIGIGLLVLAGVIVLDRFTVLSGSMLWATVLVVVGVLLYRGDLSLTRPDAPPRPPAPTGSQSTEMAAAPAETDSSPAGESAAQSGAGGGAGTSTTPPTPAAPPPPAPQAPPPPPRPPSILGRLTMGLGLLALGVLAVVDNVTNLVDPQPRHYLALATVIMGAGLLTGAFVGRARWMILLGVFLLPPLVVSPAAEINWNRDLDRTIHPASLQALEPSYQAPAGRYVFDLTDVDWNGQSANLTVDMAAGEIIVVVPDGVGLSGTASVNVGEVQTPNGTRNGIGDVTQALDLPGDDGSLNLNLNLGFGSIQIETSAPGSTQLGNSSGFGDFSVTPVDASQLADVSKPAGNITIDLRSLNLDSDATYPVSVGAGDIDVTVPEDLRVVINAHTGAGTISMFGHTSSGLGTDGSYTSPTATGPTLDLELQTGAGDITVKEGTS